ncbi:hypothetical protein [Streptomyces sp. NPDC002779]|uniref:hypothetical protein n=1 Tax=Streptomyces sp. NPDC002779 TaxID=3364664 RepID=UPI0036863301
MSDAIRGLATFSAIAIIGGICACIAGSITGDTVPIVLGVIAAVGGMILAVFAFLAHQKTRS